MPIAKAGGVLLLLCLCLDRRQGSGFVHTYF
uniref:Uncharacterized protein n=1 Tax=Arundo donax TaxID=35708 RepID=A0A0A8ZIH2_ARUDO